jgi:hypothetical protein
MPSLLGDTAGERRPVRSRGLCSSRLSCGNLEAPLAFASHCGRMTGTPEVIPQNRLSTTLARKDPVRRGQIRRSLPGAIQDQELMLEQKRLGNDGTGTARSEQASQGSDEMDEKDDPIAHHRILAGREIPMNYGRNNNSPATGATNRYHRLGNVSMNSGLSGRSLKALRIS